MYRLYVRIAFAVINRRAAVAIAASMTVAQRRHRRRILWARYAYEINVYILCELGLIKPHTFNVCVIFTHSFDSLSRTSHRLHVLRIVFAIVLFYRFISFNVLKRLAVAALRSFASGREQQRQLRQFVCVYVCDLVCFWYSLLSSPLAARRITTMCVCVSSRS